MNRFISGICRASALSRLLVLASVMLGMGPGLSGCASTPSPSAMSDSAPDTNSGVLGVLSTYKDKLLSAVGINPPAPPTPPDVPDVPDSALPDRRIKLRIFASPSLNVTDDGQPLGVVVRLYRLRSLDAFDAAALDAFGDPNKEKDALGETVVSTREVVIKPGQHYETVDKFSREAMFLGVVALFRKPAEGRWKQVFDARMAEVSGLTIGAHACALSVQVGKPLGTNASLARWAGTSCPAG